MRFLIPRRLAAARVGGWILALTLSAVGAASLQSKTGGEKAAKPASGTLRWTASTGG